MTTSSAARSSVSSETQPDEKSVLGRALTIIAAFHANERVVSLAELTRRTNIPKPTVHRIAAELVRWHVLERVDNGFRLGMYLFELGELARRQRKLRDAALPFMQDLYEATHEIVHLGVLEGLDVLYVEKISGHRGMKTPSRVGGRIPVHCTALGKAMLAYSPPAVVEAVVEAGLRPRTPFTITASHVFREELDKAAQRGVAFELEESVLGATCVASPILGAKGVPLGALSVTGPTRRFEAENKALAVRTAALGVTRSLAGVGGG